MQKLRSRTLPALIDELASEYAEAPCVSFSDETIGFAAFRRRALAFARALHSAGVRPGDRVGLLMVTRIEWLVACFRIQYAGATLVALNTWYTTRELLFVLGHARVSTLVTVDRYARTDYNEVLVTIQPWATTLPAPRRVIMLGDVAAPGTVGWDAFLVGGATEDPEATEHIARGVTARSRLSSLHVGFYGTP